jgi:hypothetical protein
LVYELNYWSQFVPVGNTFIQRSGLQLITHPQLMELSAADCPEVIGIRAALVGTKALDDLN